MAAGRHQPSPACRCASPEPNVSSRNLVVCIDGTRNRIGMKYTNIVALYNQLEESDDQQLTYYRYGIGVVSDILGCRDPGISDIVDIAVAWRLEEGIIDAYKWLANTYRHGDKIFLFGFSRGAYQVRALAGMIERVSTLQQRSSTSDFPELQLTKDSERQQEAEAFKKVFCRKDVRVHFVGVWDTVSSVGGILRSRSLPLTVTSCDHICHFRHALALDERRVKFLPEYVYGGRANPTNDDHIKEVWFPGSHRDLRKPRLPSGDIPLLWMRGEANAAGLLLKPSNLMWKIDDLDKSITPPFRRILWLVLEVLPFQRLCYNNTDKTTFW
ncbi:hypothetical protein EDD16DRAFT_1485982 [Pisolithus croceorrhizus]|nr:hypothetical protein EDD16DRAFT_1485982 [Pisolithus croceorrhizus]KAI6142289.1 hypothetical protein EDD17DRAFT_1498446 [Pisolithus thermaeus]